MSTRRRVDPAAVACVAVLLFLFAPVVTIVIFSFDKVGVGTFPLTGFTTHWYSALGSDDAFKSAAINSVKVAVAAAVISVVLGTLSSFALVRYRVRFSGTFTALLLVPIALPGLLLGVSLLSFFSWLHVPLSLWTVGVAHVLLTLPFVVLTMVARLSGFDWSLEDAARDLGATPAQTLRHVTLPLIRPSIIGSALLVAALSLDEFIVSFFTIGPQNTLPIVIWGQMRQGVSPSVNAISTLMLATTLILVMVVRRFSDVRFR
jgi:spermidine/putrescine transport system permease protein